MTAYATPSDLQAFMRTTVDAAAATLILAKVSAMFDNKARSHWGGTVAITYSKPGVGAPEIVMPYAPLVAVTQVRINGLVLTAGSDYKVIEQSLFRLMGFGIPWRFPPDLVEVDYAYGYPTVTDDVVGAVLESAAMAYNNPDPAVTSESIDDYSVKTSANMGGLRLSPGAEDLAAWYAGSLVA